MARLANASPYNPYDFANPVTQRALFSGRKSEVDDIAYYLDQAKHAPKPISLALVGNRASGKTSLLNIAEQEATDRGFCTVRINLDQSNALTKLNFFGKFFNCVLLSALSGGAFGGLEGKTYEVYQDMISTNEIPQDKTFCPFLFPIHYAKAEIAGRNTVSMLDDSIQIDMEKISAELDKPIIILMDECDVLTDNPPLLQKLRNIFMTINGYMVIMAATPNLFPLLDEVFSPIIRQFKTISIREFTNLEESRGCIERPLKQIGVDPWEIISKHTYEELHDLSGGKPYEINSICHVLFRRCQHQLQERMSLSAAALEDIRRELDKSQSLRQRRILEAIKALSRAEIQRLQILCQANGRLTLDQITCIERIFAGNRKSHNERNRAIVSGAF